MLSIGGVAESLMEVVAAGEGLPAESRNQIVDERTGEVIDMAAGDGVLISAFFLASRALAKS